jgi:hypothetical protein
MLVPVATVIGSLMISDVRGQGRGDGPRPTKRLDATPRAHHLRRGNARAGRGLSRWPDRPHGTLYLVPLALLAIVAFVADSSVRKRLLTGRRELACLGRGPKETKP